jgi:hypothetical protein
MAAPKNFLVTTISQQFDGGKVYDILQGLVSYDELSVKPKTKMKMIGYELGDLIPAICVIRQPGNSGYIYLPKYAETDTENIDLDEWMNIGKYRPIFVDNLDAWKNRSK